MALLAGKMRDTVNFQTRTTTQGPSGDPLETWTTTVSCKCSIEPLRGRELTQAQEIYSRLSTRFRLRWHAGIEPKMRAVPATGPLAGKWFVVHFVQPMDGRRYELVVMAEELPELAT